MLPLIVIGADERTKQAVEAENVGVRLIFFEDTEAAAYVLNDELGWSAGGGHPDPNLIEFDTRRNAWRCNVAYGPKSLGQAAIAKGAKLPHTGWTLALTWEMPDSAMPRRMVGDTPAGEDQSTLARQAASMLGANLLIDLSIAVTLNGRSTGLAIAFDQMRKQVEP